MGYCQNSQEEEKEMTEKYYVVSESELNHLVDCVAYNADRFYGGPAKEWYDGFEAAAACQAREVEEINAGFGFAWVEIKK
jgi:hypothetical protein